MARIPPQGGSGTPSRATEEFIELELQIYNGLRQWKRMELVNAILMRSKNTTDEFEALMKAFDTQFPHKG